MLMRYRRMPVDVFHGHDAGRDQMQLGMPDAALARDRIRKGLHIVERSAQNGYIQAVFVIEMYAQA